MPLDSPNEPQSYEVTLTEPAETEVEAAYLSRMRFGLKAAERWYANLSRALETLAVFPNRHPAAPESASLGGGVRQMIYGKGSAAYRVLYRIIPPQDDGPGLVRVLHVRHASQQRLGQTEDET